MKKYLIIFMLSLMFAVIACGPSAKELEAKRIADSTHVADSMCLVQQEQQRIADSIRTAFITDSTAKKHCTK